MSSNAANAANAADWIEAIGTVGAFGLGLLLLGRELLARRTNDARRVSAWAVETAPLRRRTEHGADSSQMGGNSVRVLVDNRGETPVYDAAVWVHLSYADEAGRHGSQERVLPPGQSEVWVDGVHLPPGGLAGHPRVDLTFQDAGGRRWQRLHDGRFGSDRTSARGRANWCARLPGALARRPPSWRGGPGA